MRNTSLRWNMVPDLMLVFLVTLAAAVAPSLLEVGHVAWEFLLSIPSVDVVVSCTGPEHEGIA